MSDEPKEREEQSAVEGDCPCSRRQAFVKLGAGSIAAAGAGAAVFTFGFLSPNVLYEPSPIVNAGNLDRFPPGSVTQDLKAGIYIVHGPAGLYSLSAVCTHLGCLTAWKPELGLIACPCHGSKFNTSGIKIEGPAPRPLPWLKAWIGDDGALMVDRSIVIPEKRYLKT